MFSTSLQQVSVRGRTVIASRWTVKCRRQEGRWWAAVPCPASSLTARSLPLDWPADRALPSLWVCSSGMGFSHIRFYMVSQGSATRNLLFTWSLTNFNFWGELYKRDWYQMEGGVLSRIRLNIADPKGWAGKWARVAEICHKDLLAAKRQRAGL